MKPEFEELIVSDNSTLIQIEYSKESLCFLLVSVVQLEARYHLRLLQRSALVFIQDTEKVLDFLLKIFSQVFLHLLGI